MKENQKLLDVRPWDCGCVCHAQSPSVCTRRPACCAICTLCNQRIKCAEHGLENHPCEQPLIVSIIVYPDGAELLLSVSPMYGSAVRVDIREDPPPVTVTFHTDPLKMVAGFRPPLDGGADAIELGGDEGDEES